MASSLGGGAYLRGSGDVRNVTLVANFCNAQGYANNTFATAKGGGVYCSNPYSLQSVLVTNCTAIGQNRGGQNQQGGGIFAESTVTVTNSDIWNCFPNAVEGSDWTPGVSGNIDADPLYCDVINGNLTLRNDSPCLPTNNPGGVQIGAFSMGCHVRVPMTLRVPSQYATIQAAMDSSIDGDTVLVASGTYREHAIFPSKRLLLMSEAGKDQTTVISDTSRCFDIPSNASVTIIGLTLTGRSVSSPGGAVSATDAKVTVRDCRISQSLARSFGGGLYAQNCSLLVIGCQIESNGMVGPYNSGGGIGGSGSLAIDSSTFSGNQVISEITTNGSAGANGGGLWF